MDQNLGTFVKQAILGKTKVAADVFANSVLTPREVEIIKLAAREMSNVDIGKRLFISDRTVETHRRHIIDKLQAKNFIGVIVNALRKNIISLSDLD